MKSDEKNSFITRHSDVKTGPILTEKKSTNKRVRDAPKGGLRRQQYTNFESNLGMMMDKKRTNEHTELHHF